MKRLGLLAIIACLPVVAGVRGETRDAAASLDEGVVVPFGTARDIDRTMTERAILPCDGAAVRSERCPFRFRGESAF